MRKITSEAAYAFINRRPYRRGNTRTDGKTFYLHGNPIARWEDNTLEISSAGWMSNTTKERLNGILYLLNQPRITQKNWVWYIGDKPWLNTNVFTNLNHI